MTATPGIAIVGAACRYPDADSPAELWENVLAGRRAFRLIPAERLPMAEYGSRDRSAVDRTYATHAALLEGYRFDRVKFRVSGATYKSVDPAHWLALDVAAEALTDAGFPDGLELPRSATAVLVGNTLTGEFSRATSLRLRWPYVKRVVDGVLAEAGEGRERRAALLPRIEAAFKAPFAEPNGETLAGALSNTIAGRICNHFDLHGGGYTLDAACASSLLAVAQACSALAARDVDAAIAGGVDVSLDPFELVGFARAGALASDDMRVFDASPTGFWPGEGCGFVVLMRETDAVAAGRRIYAVIRGWGVSSDGSGGLTRPEPAGQVLALERAYARAGFDAGSVSYFEAHGTGTAVGDATELAALSTIRRRTRPALPPAAIGSIKANIGHTKAAAGIAGVLKAMLAVHHDIVPPTCGTREPHPALGDPDCGLRVQERPQPWPSSTRRAGVSAMGFGGINVHVVLEDNRRRPLPRRTVEACSRSWQDAELFVLSADTASALREHAERIAALAPVLSLSELTDLAIHLQRHSGAGAFRAAVVASTPAELAAKLAEVADALRSGSRRYDIREGIFVGDAVRAPRIAFLFSGQAAPVRTRGGIWARRFAAVDALYASGGDADPLDTSVAQPAIVTASLAALRCLEDVGLHADAAIGHSLGELSALRWSGALPDDASAIGLAMARGRLMADLAEQPGAMAALAADRGAAERLIAEIEASIAGVNGPQQTVVSGFRDDVDRVIARAHAQGIGATRLPVACAFHSPLMGPVAGPYRAVLAATPLGVPGSNVISTVTGRPVLPDTDLRALLEQQLCSPVLFSQAIAAAGSIDLFIELGPGHTLASLAALCSSAPAVSVDAAGASLKPLLIAIAAAYAAGAPVRMEELAAERFARPFAPDRKRAFLVNPCELVPGLPAAAVAPIESAALSVPVVAADRVLASSSEDTCEVLRALVARHADLPLEAIGRQARFLSDLHLNSITVAEILAEAARRVGVPAFVSPTDFADASLADTARVLDEAQKKPAAQTVETLAGVESWVRAFIIDEEEGPPAANPPPAQHGDWEVVASPDHPLRASLAALLRDGRNGPGTVVCLDPGAAPSVSALLDSAKAVLRGRQPRRFVVVQERAMGSGLARSLFLESGTIDVGVVTADFSDPETPSRICAEARGLAGFVDVRYDDTGRRLLPVARVTDVDRSGDAMLGEEDVLLVTGGGKGIAAECALALAKECGVKLALVGRADPASDPALASNLQRMRGAGIALCYERADVGDAAAVRDAVSRVRATLGEITAVLHAAGTNDPCLIASLDEPAIDKTLRPKVDGARHAIDACDPSRLRLFVSFGSIIARTGLAGEAHYALANDRLREFTMDVMRRLPHCRALAIEWSVWSGAGMGERLGRIEPLVRQGISPIALDEGVAWFTSLLRSNGPSGTLIVSGRFGQSATLRLAPAPLPCLRFLENPRLFYPGIELVADATLSLASDPYLGDHRFDGQLLFPAVLGLEAMVQAAVALHGGSALPELSDIEFSRPLIVPAGGRLVLRTAAYQEPGGRVRVQLRAGSTAFAVEHFRATCSWVPIQGTAVTPSVPEQPADAVDAGTTRGLYGPLLFQSGRFARVRRYLRLFATECVAEVAAEDTVWFGAYLPVELLLGDPGARDGTLHCIQASVPHRRVVPVAVERISIRRPLSGPCRVRARQRGETDDTFTWDLDVIDSNGDVAETWSGVQLRSVARLSPAHLPAPLLGPYVERQLAALGHVDAARVLVTDAGGVPLAAGAGKAAAERLTPATYRRPDGRPEADDGDRISASHAGGLTMVVACRSAVGCDVEPVAGRPQHVWRDLLGSEREALADLIARERPEPYDVGATRLWAAAESLKKAGAAVTAHLVLDQIKEDGWVTLRAGRYSVSTWVAEPSVDQPFAVAVATGDAHARL